LLSVISDLRKHILACVFHDDDYALFLFVPRCVSLARLLSFCNLCVVVGAGADRPRDGI